MKKVLALTTIFLLLSAPNVFAQGEPCTADFNCDGNVDATDVTTFLSQFGRSQYNDPCPPCVPLTPVPKTGQTTCYDTDGNPRDCAGSGEDGEFQSGYERFTDNGDGTVTDTFTKLIWLKDANCIATHYPDYDQDGDAGDGAITWQHALDFVKGINDGTYPLCGAGHNDWRLPNVNEAQSLSGNVPLEYYFSNYEPRWDWSSSTHPRVHGATYKVAFNNPIRYAIPKNSAYLYVLPVRGRQ